MWDGASALFLAAQNGHSRFACHIDGNIGNWLACRQNDDRSSQKYVVEITKLQIRVVAYLLEQPGLPLDTQRRDGASPLWIAAQVARSSPSLSAS